MGQGRPNSKYVGGASDSSNLQRGGTPVVCSMGVIGEHNHTFDEYAIVETLFERAKLLTAVVDRIDEFKIK
ncbi:MAG: glutamate carboxypeptidase [Clostridium sp.]|jgi:glutamate carboxypeptidase